MSLDLVLTVVTIPVGLAWALMVFAPRWKLTRAFIHSDAIQLGIAAIYLALVAPLLPWLLTHFDTLDHIGEALAVRPVLLAGWIHYLAFDLLVGRVILGDAQRRGIPHLWVAPCLVLTFMLGPLGYAAYALVRALTKKLTPPVAPLA
jgi:hypothetical protein